MTTTLVGCSDISSLSSIACYCLIRLWRRRFRDTLHPAICSRPFCSGVEASLLLLSLRSCFLLFSLLVFHCDHEIRAYAGFHWECWDDLWRYDTKATVHWGDAFGKLKGV
jgi:hypothetical protein